MGNYAKDVCAFLAERNEPTKVEDISNLTKAQRKKWIQQRVRTNTILNGMKQLTAETLQPKK